MLLLLLLLHPTVVHAAVGSNRPHLVLDHVVGSSDHVPASVLRVLDGDRRRNGRRSRLGGGGGDEGGGCQHARLLGLGRGRSGLGRLAGDAGPRHFLWCCRRRGRRRVSHGRRHRRQADESVAAGLVFDGRREFHALEALLGFSEAATAAVGASSVVSRRLIHVRRVVVPAARARGRVRLGPLVVLLGGAVAST